MAFLLDTVTVSEMRRPDRTDPRFALWQQNQSGQPGYVSVITLNEIRYGLWLVKAKDPDFALVLAAWYDHLVAQPHRFPVIPIDREVAEIAGDFRAEFRMAYNDSLIAATAEVHGLTLATRNTSDFEETGVSLVNPWDFEG